MKQILTLAAAACAFTAAHAGTTCVYTKTKTLPNYSLALVHPISVYKAPDVTSESKQITEVVFPRPSSERSASVVARVHC
ncbi:hypothetical protein PQR33_35635 [Paraburkholderia sediminicola]|uniref:hypothetical protein n=1 Tax=Paraburkholderia sediminicola TaxID=458836 RepID=UPI0038BB1CF4